MNPVSREVLDNCKAQHVYSYSHTHSHFSWWLSVAKSPTGMFRNRRTRRREDVGNLPNSAQSATCSEDQTRWPGATTVPLCSLHHGVASMSSSVNCFHRIAFDSLVDTLLYIPYIRTVERFCYRKILNSGVVWLSITEISLKLKYEV